ncbi:MAG TPA: YceI family protein [Gemmatimonadales bacterium]|nr:YceI family protein [Gemmatimonadales bacterium]
MRPSAFAVMLLGMWSAGAMAAQEPRTIVPSRVASGTLSFDAHATVGDFTGTTSTVSGGMTGAATLAEVRGCVEAPTNTLVTGKGRRDRDLNSSMETDKYPLMRFELKDVSPTSEPADSMTAALMGDLTLHGLTRPDTVPSTLVWTGDTLHLRAEFPVDVKDYGVGGLTKFLGALKMDEHILVHVDLTFVPGPGGCGGA